VSSNSVKRLAEKREAAPYDEAIKIFVEEFLEDTADLMLDYGLEV